MLSNACSAEWVSLGEGTEGESHNENYSMGTVVGPAQQFREGSV
jgi:hypothetical protein